MTLIGNTTYNTNNLYYYPNEKLFDLTPASTGSKSEKNTKNAVQERDTVTFSTEVANANTRETLGLNPTGRLKLVDFETVAENEEQTVKSMLASFMEDLNIETNQKISLSLDTESNITIKESFSGKSKLEETLNEDKDFSLSFNRLSANREFLNYTKNIQTQSTNSLADFINSDSDWTDIFSLASKYSEIKYSSNPLASLLSISKSQEPYTFTYDPIDL